MIKFFEDIARKLNPAQSVIASEQSNQSSTQYAPFTQRTAYRQVEIVNRCINILIDSGAQVGFDVKDKLSVVSTNSQGIRQVTLKNLLTYKPNPYQDINKFRRLAITDLLVEGNCFLYFDGAGLYLLPAINVEVIADSKTWVHEYIYNQKVKFKPSEIIHVSDNSLSSLYRGDSRTSSYLSTLGDRQRIIDFKTQFYKNGAVVGMILETEAILSKKLKDRMEKEISTKFRPGAGSYKPFVVDGGVKAKQTSNTNFREQDINGSLEYYEKQICMALGVPEVLLKGGNNANIRPNVELLFFMTILPMMKYFESAYESFFGFDIELVTHNIPALRPEAKEQSDRLSALVNNGIMTGNEARKELRLEELDDPLMQEIRIPQNVSGSASNVTGQEGGKPPQPDNEE